ncbi:HesA/MoeB/ThiF family protein [Methylophilaceae bacterium]|jgi:molybdopterin/thiamine biosynthesis adenylyltransferase|nr:HesA/MoeB/ThiF family protein [Betaproteobacteria bacterium]MDA9086010.1 HesA/MoeB/ThiF family protein [Methylophilaceae bacterium]MDC1281323.1 HesA/MoeB/ThiF family protein [Methylophilaceae bacterium]
MQDNQLERYSRHILLPEIEYAGQEKLLNSHALIVGAGGLGSPVAIYLASSGVGTLTVCDFDDVDLSNLQRQILHSESTIGINKAVSAKHFLNKVNLEINVIPVEGKLDIASMKKIAINADVIIDCSDNFTTRYALNQIAFDLKKPLVSGAAIKFEGQLSVFDFRNPLSPCYECLFPDTQDDQELRCSDHGVFAPLVGMIGSAQAAEAIKILLSIGETLVGSLGTLNIKSMKWQMFTVKKDPACKVCSAK